MDQQRCAALKAELATAQTLLAETRAKSGIRAVQDSDGSRIEYSSTGLAAQEANVRRLETLIDTLCGGCRATGPYGFTF